MASENSCVPLGSTSIRISPIGLGVMQLAGDGGPLGLVFPHIAPQDKNAIIQAALDGGVNWFDTAEMYGFGSSERALAAGLKAAGRTDSEVVVATKWMPALRTARNIPRTIHQRLRCLDGYSIGLYMVHQPWSFSTPEAEMDAMADLVEAGLIRSVGVSNFNPERMRRAHAALQKRGLPLAANQMQYSLLHRQIESDGTLETAKELGVTIIAYTPLAYGLLTGKYHQDPALLTKRFLLRRRGFERRMEASRPLIAALGEIGTRYAATPAQVALNWLIHFQGESVVAIPGATSVRQAAESAAAMRFKLTPDEMDRLDQMTRQFR